MVTALCVACLGRTLVAQEALREAFSGAPVAHELRRRLAALPAAELARLFHLAVEGRLTLAEGQGVLPLDEPQLEAVRAALVARPRHELLTFLEGLARAPLELRERLEAQRVLASAGSGDHLRLLLRLSSAPDGALPLQELRASFAAALGAILARDEHALEQIPALLSECPPGLASSLVEAVAGLPGVPATRILARLLGRVPALDGLLLGRLAQRGSGVEPGDEFLFEGLRRYLRHADPALASAACHAVARLADEAAIEELIVLLERGEERARAAAGQALAEITGLDHGADVERWVAWFQAETRWWSEQAEGELARVESARGPEYVRASRAVLEHRLYRARMAESFVQALGRREAREVWLACRALGELRSRLAVPALVECLEHDDATVRDAAWRALRAITGAELPPESDSWASFAG